MREQSDGGMWRSDVPLAVGGTLWLAATGALGFDFHYPGLVAYLAIAAATATAAGMHVRWRLPAVDIFEHGYRAGWEDAAMHFAVGPYPSNGRVVPIARRRSPQHERS